MKENIFFPAETHLIKGNQASLYGCGVKCFHPKQPWLQIAQNSHCATTTEGQRCGSLKPVALSLKKHTVYFHESSEYSN